MVQIYYSKEKYEVKKYNDGSEYVADKDTGKNVLSRISNSIIDIIDDNKEDIVVNISFEHAIEDNRGVDIFRHCYDNLTPSQREEAFENAIETSKDEYSRGIYNKGCCNNGSYIFEFMYDKLSKHQRLIALENAIDNHGFEQIITEDGIEMELFPIFVNFMNVKDNIKEMLQDFKKEGGKQ